MAYAKNCDIEISGFGHYSVRNRNIIIDELFPLMKQVCTPAETEPHDISELYNSPKLSKRINFWWHSHVNMGVFWSGQDNSCIDQMGKTAMTSMISLVVNKKGEYRLRFDYFKPFGMFLDKIDLQVVPPQLSQRDINVIKREISKKVILKKIEPTVVKNTVFNDVSTISKPPLSTRGFFDESISSDEETRLLKLGYMYDETLKKWIFPFGGE